LGVQLGRRGVLEQKTRGTVLQGREHHFVGVESRQHDHPGQVAARLQRTVGCNPVHPWHTDVHEHDIG
jgi:hypothetical protein